MLLAVGLLLGGAGALGCETGFRTPSAFETMPVADLESVTPLRAADLFPLEAQSGVYERNSDGSRNREYEYVLRQEGDEWILEIDERHRVYLRERPDGGIVLRRYENLRQDVQVEVEPAMLMLPGRIDDTIHEGNVQLTVHGLLGRRTMRGEGRYRLRLAGTRQVETPEGEREAYIIQQEQQVRMPLARAQVQLETAYVEGLGRVMDQLVREHRVLGLFGDDVKESYQRVK